MTTVSRSRKKQDGWTRGFRATSYVQNAETSQTRNTLEHNVDDLEMQKRMRFLAISNAEVDGTPSGLRMREKIMVVNKEHEL